MGAVQPVCSSKCAFSLFFQFSLLFDMKNKGKCVKGRKRVHTQVMVLLIQKIAKLDIFASFFFYLHKDKTKIVNAVGNSKGVPS